MHRQWIIAAALAVAAGPALAQEDEHEGFYLGAGLGDFSSAVDNIGSLDDVDDVGLDFDADEDAVKLFGGWRFNRFVAAQLDYVDFGESTAALNLLDISSETKGIAPSIVGTLPVGPVELFARVGIMFYDLEIDGGGGSIVDESDRDPVYGAGIGITILDRLSLRAEYEEIDIDALDEADAVWLTAAWRF